MLVGDSSASQALGETVCYIRTPSLWEGGAKSPFFYSLEIGKKI